MEKMATFCGGVLNEDKTDDVVAWVTRMEKHYPNLTREEVARKVLDDELYLIWTNRNKVAAPV